MTSLRFDPFRDFDRLASEVWGTSRSPRLMPMDAYRDGDSYVLRFDLPGIQPGSLDVVAEKNTLTVRAERKPEAGEGVNYVVAERPSGTYSRQIVVGDGLNLEAVKADYNNGVLTVSIPVAEQAKPRRIEVGLGEDNKVLTA
ncbi:Hsp20/alpha crystallin family protein [Catelliglobosispora koreensis]|uniref:Hsp20/alpha crystallin family protein n=1 Tax=Catelliglobosispora koreensis TaxID=129052 RepID=UPI00037058A8|nr:Hsp20/alpha crystallin family protein [Catelliglobosispora koreensis]